MFRNSDLINIFLLSMKIKNISEASNIFCRSHWIVTVTKFSIEKTRVGGAYRRTLYGWQREGKRKSEKGNEEGR